MGSGAREHALAWSLRRSRLVSEVLGAPGNPGMARLGRCFPVRATDIPGLVHLVEEQRPDLVVVGPEEPLALGLVDVLRARGFAVFGPTQRAARIESSKSFAKELLGRYGIPQPAYQVFEDPEEAMRWVRSQDGPCVVKADGLAAGKGSLVCRDSSEAEAAIHALMVEGRVGEAGRRVVIEEYLEGEEASALAFVSGERVVPMPLAQDHKRLLDGDRGPNTGGMGAVAPLRLSSDLPARVVREILEPTARALCTEGTPFCGVLYAGLMLTRQGPKVLEFNARFGDPEAQALLPLLATDLGEVLLAVCEGRLGDVPVRWVEGSSCCVVLASEGYPAQPVRGRRIYGLERLEGRPEVLVFHAGTEEREGAVYTAGGRVLSVVGLGDTLRAACEAAYRAVEEVRFEGMHFRRDIGRRARAHTGA
ncbi:MAG: phosphoribosylamine--glycine ligase [Armatimonadota bacterium]|nr:phosphoribosylamine--glycine ligase [Armatimonadota bacterium]MDR7561979.1 phosphoribosylamine--glycine ligase [Armatimonadota bacterium]MDR7566926.1 phosphoribosylamine--glycine ligase [Armatimonadota bacterium]